MRNAHCIGNCSNIRSSMQNNRQLPQPEKRCSSIRRIVKSLAKDTLVNIFAKPSGPVGVWAPCDIHDQAVDQSTAHSLPLSLIRYFQQTHRRQQRQRPSVQYPYPQQSQCSYKYYQPPKPVRLRGPSASPYSTRSHSTIMQRLAPQLHKASDSTHCPLQRTEPN